MPRRRRLGANEAPGVAAATTVAPSHGVVRALASGSPTDTNPLAPCLRTMFEVRPPGVTLLQAVSASGDHLHRGARPFLS